MICTYKVREIFTSIQGEGCLTGIPMVFVRLQGCLVRCPWCDTKDSWDLAGGFDFSEEDFEGTFAPLREEGLSWVLLTGGEPMEQDLGCLLDYLNVSGWKVALETSGIALGGGFHTLSKFSWVCLSPKEHRPPLSEVVHVADELKFVVSLGGGTIERVESFLVLYGQDIRPECQICLQPVSLSKEATDICINACQRKGWRLSVQTQKFLGLR